MKQNPRMNPDATRHEREPKIGAWPHVVRVVLGMAYDNGLIYRQCTENDFLVSLDSFVSGEEAGELDALNEWVGSLSDEQICVLASGEYSEMSKIEATCPRQELCTFFERVFEVM